MILGKFMDVLLEKPHTLWSLPPKNEGVIDVKEKEHLTGKRSFNSLVHMWYK